MGSGPVAQEGGDMPCYWARPDSAQGKRRGRAKKENRRKRKGKGDVGLKGMGLGPRQVLNLLPFW